MYLFDQRSQHSGSNFGQYCQTQSDFLVREINTKPRGLTSQSNSRIEIVEWDDTVSSIDQKSSSTKHENITLTQIMMGSTGGQ